MQQVGEIANADWAAAGTRAFVSDEYHRLYGLPPGEVAGTFDRGSAGCIRTTARGSPPRRGSSTKQPHAVALQFRIRRPDGMVRWIAMRAESFREPDGSLRIISGHQDITDLVAGREALAQRRDELERQVAERTAALVEAEEQFRAVFNSQFQFVAVLALDGTVLLANRTALLAGGLRSRRRHRPPVLAYRMVAALPNPSGCAPGSPRRPAAPWCGARWRCRTPDGHSLWIDLSFKPVLDSVNGQVRQIVAEWRDVTELRELAEKLAQAQKVQALGQLAGGHRARFQQHPAEPCRARRC